ncbi:ferredoxin family protein [Chloroflexota bacterium]
MPPEIDDKKCNACGVCATVCPQDVFWGSGKKQVPVISYPEECWHCNACVLDCPVEGAITLTLPLPMFICYK